MKYNVGLGLATLILGLGIFALGGSVTYVTLTDDTRDVEEAAPVAQNETSQTSESDKTDETAQAQTQSETNGTVETNTENEQIEEKPYQEPVITWRFAEAGEREHIPYTTVFVTVNGTTHKIGDFQGSCSEIGASGGIDGTGLLAGELSAVQCWFAGGGDEIGVFAVEDGTLEIMTGVLSEGIEGGASFRGDFTIRTEFPV